MTEEVKVKVDKKAKGSKKAKRSEPVGSTDEGVLVEQKRPQGAETVALENATPRTGESAAAGAAREVKVCGPLWPEDMQSPNTIARNKFQALSPSVVLAMENEEDFLGMLNAPVMDSTRKLQTHIAKMSDEGARSMYEKLNARLRKCEKRIQGNLQLRDRNIEKRKDLVRKYSAEFKRYRKNWALLEESGQSVREKLANYTREARQAKYKILQYSKRLNEKVAFEVSVKGMEVDSD